MHFLFYSASTGLLAGKDVMLMNIGFIVNHFWCVVLDARHNHQLLQISDNFLSNKFSNYAVLTSAASLWQNSE